jgi:hypothetical protein
MQQARLGPTASTCINVEPCGSHIDKHKTIQNISAPKGEFVESPQFSKPVTASSYELRPCFIAMVREPTFSGLDYENPLLVFVNLSLVLVATY